MAPRKKKMLVRADGTSIEESILDPHIVERHYLVEDVFKRAAKINMQLKHFQEMANLKLKIHLDKLAERKGAKWQGNIVLINFSETKKIEIAIAKRLVCDERLNLAKSKIDDFIKSKLVGSDGSIIAIVDKAFKLDKRQQVDTKRILELRSIKIDDPVWIEAMDLISESVHVLSAKQYTRFYHKDAKGKWQHVSLQFSAL